MVNHVRTLYLQNDYLDKNEQWTSILSAMVFSVRITYNATLQDTPGQLVFDRDMLLNTTFIAYWEAITRLKQQLLDKIIKNENKNR